MNITYLFKLQLILVFLFVLNGKTAADELYRTLDEREQQASLIVNAKVVSLVPLKFPQDLYERKVAILEVQNIAKGHVDAGFILVSVGYYWPGGVINSQDIALAVGMSGTWLLSKDESGLFKLNSPGDLMINK